MSAPMPRFHRLTVSDVRGETSDAVSIAFAVPGDLREDFSYHPGQYLTLRRDFDGEEIRRSYSICSGPEDGELRIAVKRVDGGLFSSFATGTLRRGEAIEVMTPTGRFGIVPDRARSSIYVGFAAGSGITPILSIVRGVLASEPGSRFFLFYGNRSTADIVFREALEELKDRFMSRLSVFHILSREEQDLPILNGRLDGDKARMLLGSIVPVASIDQVFICGPEGMGEELQAACLELGLRPGQIHLERFVSARGGKPRPQPIVVHTAPPRAVASLVVDGKRKDVPIHDGETVLEAALRAGMDLPYACKGGMCSTCRAKVVEGEVTMDVNYSLEPWELEAGFVLTCQSHPVGSHVMIDYDQM